MKELRNELTRLQSDFEQKWSSQTKMVSTSPISRYIILLSFQVDANNRSIFKMNDKMAILNDWFHTLGICEKKYPEMSFDLLQIMHYN